MTRTAWIIVLLAAILAQFATAASVQTQTAELIEVPRAYRLDGVVEAVQQSTISAQTSGQVTEVLFDVDDLVQQGDVILVIEDSEQQANLASAQANLASARAQRADAEKEYQRIKSVYAKEAVSKATMDKATAGRNSARAAVDAAEAALSQAEQQVGYTQVRAPYTGIVTERFVEVGEVASRGQRLMSGISLQQLRVQVDVPQSLINAVRKQQDAMVLLNGRWIRVTHLTVYPVADPATDTFRVRLNLPQNIEGLFPGMYVKVALHLGTRRSLVVPRTSVVFRSEVIGVYVVDAAGAVSLRHVRLGSPLPDGRYSIISGLNAGELVALDPHAAVVALKEQRKERAANE